MIYFVTEQYIKLNTPITDNVDQNELNPLIQVAADTFVRSILGTYFYNDLLNKYNAQTLDTPPATGEVLIVQSYIQPAVAWRTCAEAVMTTAFQLKNKGPQTQSGDFSAAAEKSAVNQLFHHYRDRADFYDNRLLQYLIDNGSTYPAFLNLLNVDTIVPHWPHCACGCGGAFGGGCVKYKSGNAFQSGIQII